MVQRRGRMDRFAKKLNMKFALPGLIALAIMAFVHDLLPRPVQFYVYISVMATLLVGLLSGQFRLLGLEQAEAARRHDPEQTLNRWQMAVVYAGILPTVVLMVLICMYVDYSAYFVTAFLGVVGVGTALIYLLRTRPPTEDQPPAPDSGPSAEAESGD